VSRVVLSLAAPRTDDPLKGVAIPVSEVPTRNDPGSYDQHTPPLLTTSAEIGDYIQPRTAPWSQHRKRLRQRRAAAQPADPESGWETNQEAKVTEKGLVD
jgi:hypothetical protein